jgi:NADH:ubiquinone oxidoreductase subunit 3 (subunit A)
VGGLICRVLTIPIFTPAAPETVNNANILDAIYFIDPQPFYAEIIAYDHDVFGAKRRRLSMNDVMSGDLIYVFAFLLAGLVFAGGPFVVVHLLAARKTRNYAGKTDQYIECGMEPIGDAWIRYSAVYYLYALVFVAFAVDVLFLIPVALVYDRVAEFVYRDFVELLIFVGILSLVIVYAWKKGVFEWKRKQIMTKP